MTDDHSTREPDNDDAFTPTYADYSGEDLLEQAQGNAQAALVATVAFLNERGIPLDSWGAALGHSFAQEWGEPEPWSPDEFLDAMLTNYRSLGAIVNWAEFRPDGATAEISAFPDVELCARFGVSVADVSVFHGTAAAIASERGLDWTWSLTDTSGDAVTTEFRVALSESFDEPA